MRHAEAGRHLSRWLPSALALVVLGAVPAVLAQSADPPSRPDHPGYHDLVALPNGMYGVEVRASGTQARVEARVGENTSRADSFKSVEAVPASRQRLTVQWSAREVRVILGGQSIRYPAGWQIGNAIRISARGGVRVNVATAGGRRVDKNVAGSPTPETASELIVSGSYLTKSWTLESTIDWPDEPTADDVVTVTTGHQDPTSQTSARQSPNRFSGGVEDSSLFVLPQGQQQTRIGRGTPRTWTGNVSKNWSDPGNWSPAGVPTIGDVLTFASGPNQTTLNNDPSPSPPLGGVIVTNGNYQIQGNGLTLANDSQSQINRDFKVDTLLGGGVITIVNQTSLVVGRQGQPTPVTPTTFSGTITGSNAIFEKDGPGAFTFTGDASGVEETRVTQGNFDLVGGSLSTVFVTGPNETFAMSNNAHVGFLNVRNNGEIGDLLAGVATTGDIQMEDMSYVQTISATGGMKLVATGTVKLSFNGNSVLTIVSGNYTPPPGSVIIMVQNDGTDPVAGVFRATNGSQLGEGSIILIGGAQFRLSYRCNAEATPARCTGDGNDIGVAAVDTGPTPHPDLAISKTASGSFAPGGTGTFTLKVMNVGTAPASGTAATAVTVTDIFPTGFAPTSASGAGWSCPINAQQVTCTRADSLPTGQSYPDITITAQVATNAQNSSNFATVQVDGDQNPNNNSAEVAVVVPRAADLTLSKTHTGTFQQGGTGTYSIVVANSGTGPSAGVVTVTDTVPVGLSAPSASGTGWSCNTSTLTVTCTRSDALAAGSLFPAIQLGVTISPTAPSIVTNTATVAGGGDSVTTNNTANDVTAIAAVTPDLTIVKSQVAPPFVQGRPGQFLITVTNGGKGPTNGLVTAADLLPDGLTPTQATGPGWTCPSPPLTQTVQCTRSDPLAAGLSYPPITLTVNVATAAQDLMNIAKIGGGGDNTPLNNVMRLPVVISTLGPAAEPNLTVAKTHTGVVEQGGTVTFTITVSLHDAASSGTVTVTDQMPAGLTATSASGTGWSCSGAQSVVCTRSDVLQPNSPIPPISLTASVSPTAVSDTNTATVSGGGDVSPEDNFADDPYTVGVRSADLTITKTHTGQFTPGGSATFMIHVSNVGPVPTSGPVAVIDTMPTASLTPTAATGSGWSCTIAGQQVTCMRSDPLASNNASYPDISLAASVLPTAQSDTNVATVSGGGDANTDNNTARDPFVVSGTPNLTMTKTHTGNFVVGQLGATYQIVVKNTGTAPTAGLVSVDDPLPVGLTPVSAAGQGWTCTVAGQAVNCQRSDSLGAGQPWPAITMVVNVGEAAGTLNNIATLSGGGDSHPDDNSVVDSTVIVGQPQLTLIKTHVDPVQQGDRDLPFTITVSNNGTGPTSGTVTVTDPLPAGLTPVDAAGSGWTCTVAAPNVTCTRADALGPAADYPPIQIRANVGVNAVTVTNVATVAGGGDTTPADNSFHDLVPITPIGQPNLVISKRHDGDFIQGQQNAVYHIRVANFGTRPATGDVTVTDDLPAGLTPASAAGAGWTCAIAGLHVQCTRADSLSPGAAYPEILITVVVSPTATDVVNVAWLAGGNDQTPTDNTVSDATHIVPSSPDLIVLKQHADPFLAGQPDAVYHITVQNVGPAPSTGEVDVVDGVPNGLMPTSAAGAGWTCTIATQTMTCRRSDSLTAGASFPEIALHVTVQPGASNVVNVVAVSGGGDANLNNNTASDATSINVAPDATIGLNLASTLIVADDAEYQATVTNLGPGSLGGMTQVVTSFPAELVPLLAEGDGWTCSTVGQQMTCRRIGPLDPNATFSVIRYKVFVRTGPGQVTVTAAVANSADSNAANNQATLSSQTTQPTLGLNIANKTVTPQVAIGGAAGYQVDVTNSGQIRLNNVVVTDLLPRGFKFVDAGHRLVSTQRNAITQPVTDENGSLVWPIGTLEAGETETLTFTAIVGADARSGFQDSRASAAGADPLGTSVPAGPATATVQVVTETFTMLQAIVGRVFEDVDGNGMFGGADRPIAHARVITSTGQAALTDAAGMYNIPSIGSGTVAISLDRDTIPAGLTLDGGPGGRSWTRLLRTPIGGGTVLTQDFGLKRAAQAAPGVAAPAPASTPPNSPAIAAEINRVPDDSESGHIPPRRDYETRDGSSLLIGLGEVSFGRAAQEFELFQKDADAWGYGSVFYQGTVGSPKNHLTFAADSRRNLNGTTDQDRLFELDPNDRMYPVFGDASTRQEFATSNSKVFARLERGASHVMYGDLIGDLPSSDNDGGRWSSYQRHLTGVEVRVANEKGDHVTVRGASPNTAYAREVFEGGTLGLITLGHADVLSGTETVAIEVRDRRMPDRLLSRAVLARGVDYELEPETGTLFMQRNVAGLDPQLNLAQVVVTYEYDNQGAHHLVFNGRASGTFSSIRIGGTFFTEEAVTDQQFTVAGFDLDQKLPHGGRWRLNLPYSHGTPSVASSVDSLPVNPGADLAGWAVQGDVEQPVEFWSGVLKASFLHADDTFQNPYSATITPGAGYVTATADLLPLKPSHIHFGGTYERYNTATVDASRTTFSGEWAQDLGHALTLKAGYDGRSLDQSAQPTIDSGLFTAQALVRVGDRLEAHAGREQNVRDDKDPTYPDQTTLGARLKLNPDATLFYTQRISDSAIVPIGDFASTGFSELATKGELSAGVESRVRDTTQLTSQYRVEQGINGPDAFAVIGVQTHVKLDHTLGATFGVEHGQLVSGPDASYTSGSFAVDWLPSDRLKTTTRYEGRNRGGYASLFSAGAAARLYAGFTGLGRVEWTSADQTTNQSAKAVLAALALRPANNDRLGWLLSYQYVNRDSLLPTVAPGSASLGWRHLLSTDGYAQVLPSLELHGKFAWQRTDDTVGPQTDTYLSQGRVQIALSRYVDGAFEARYIEQPASSSHRVGNALEVGFWPIADARVAIGYNFNDTRDPLGRDLEGRAKGVYLTLSTKLSYLFDLFGNRAPAAAQPSAPGSSQK